MTELIEGEIVEATELVPYVPASTAITFVEDAEEFLAIATKQAKILKSFLDKSKSVVRIGQTEHVKVGGWQFLAQQAGLTVGTTAEELRLEDDSGWKAHANVYRDGKIVGEADALCLRSESNWKNRDTYALCSMAQTRAISKSIKGILGFVVVMAGYSDTPAEEMPRDEPMKRAAVQKTELPGETFEDIFQESHTSGETPTKAAATKLNLLVVELRDAGKITTWQLYQSVGLMRDVDPGDLGDAMKQPDEEGIFHWGPLAKTLSKGEAHQLIDRLSKLQAAE
jgi:hypothetical protein